MASGITAAKIAPMLMSSTMTPYPERNSAVNTMIRISGRGPVASGMRTMGAVNTTQPRT